MIANSCDEWSPLKEVIVGSPVNFVTQSLDISFKAFFHDVAYPSYQKNPRQKIRRQYVDELVEDVTGLVNTLERLGVKVYRPTALKRQLKINTPYWHTTTIPALNIRDQAIVIGNEIIETPPQVRARYFENDLLKPIFYKYFRDGTKWTVMPRPMLTDHSIDLSYIADQNPDAVASTYVQHHSEFDMGHEMIIDGAQCVRFGRDILINIANENHELGYQWLQQHLDTNFRFHKVYRLADNHIDSIILPLRPGLLLMRSPRYYDRLPEIFKKWDAIYLPETSQSNFPEYEEDDLILTSKFIDLNVLSVDEEKVIVNSDFPELIRLLEKHGFTPIPVRHRHRRIFGGGFHCFTLDTVREGSLNEYL